MSQRTWRPARLRTLVLLIMATLTAALRGQETRRSLQQSWYSRSEPFSHRWHVPDLWRTVGDKVNDAGNVDPKAPPNRPVAPPAEDARLLGETRRDCRGCHRYEAGKEQDPQAVCAECHYRPGAIERQFDPGFEQDLARLRRRDRRFTPFAHQDHLAIGCRACHEPDNQFSDRMPVIEGTALCIQCHQDRGPGTSRAADWAPPHRITGRPRPEWLRDPDENVADGGHSRFLARLNDHPSMGPDGFEKFRHKDHIASVNRDDRNKCDAACHRAVSDADVQALGAATVGAESLKRCAYCHLAKTPQRLDFTLATVERPSPSALTFLHAEHFKAKKPENEKDLPGTCSRCHVYTESSAGDEYPLVKELTQKSVYDGCVSCHYHEQKHKLPDHGEVAGCAACHAPGGGPMQSNRPVDPVARVRPTFFLVEQQTHPFLTESKGPRDQSCSDKCHRMQSENLPSRVTGRRFEHKSHLPTQPKANDCQPCHGRISGTKGPADILATYDTEAPAVAGQLAQPDAKVCGRCHLGSTVVAQIPTDAPPQQAQPRVRFPHDQHLGLRTRAMTQVPAMDCVTCHMPGAEYGADVGTTKEALTCQPCHRHKDWQVEITGRKDKEYVATCGQCHRAGVPADNSVVMASTQRIQGVQGTQVHDREPTCSCHSASQETLRPEGEAHVRARLRSVHTDEKEKPKNCLGCHWEMNLVGALDFSFVTGSPAFKEFFPRSQQKLGNPPKRAVRSFVGGELQGYPGRNTVK